MTLPFIKMHGLGNDFAIFDMRGRDAGVLDTDVIRRLSDRKTGIGCDQFIVLEETKHADVFMRIFNTDGSQAEACGNAARCVGALLCEELGKMPSPSRRWRECATPKKRETGFIR